MFGTIFTKRENKKKNFSAWKRKIYKNMNIEIVISKMLILSFCIGVWRQNFQNNENKQFLKVLSVNLNIYTINSLEPNAVEAKSPYKFKTKQTILTKK